MIHDRTTRLCRPRFLRWSLVVGHWSFALAALAGLRQPVSDMDPKKGVEIFVESSFEKVPLCGFAPLRLIVRNDSPADHTWTFQFDSDTAYGNGAKFQSGASVNVQAKSERIVEVMVPIATAAGTYSYPRLTTRVFGYGAGSGAMQMWASSSPAYGSKGVTPSVAMSQTLASSVWSLLEAKTRAEGLELSGTQFDPSKSSGDYRGWLGCDTVWLSESDWLAFNAAQQQAVLDWVKLGGRLHICHSDTSPATIAGIPSDDEKLGLGRIDRVSSRRNSDFVDAVARTVRGEPHLLTTIDSGYSTGWPLRASIPPIVIHSVLILVFVVIFATLIGPVNLFLLARKKKHMHLFWTTPALAILASIALAVLIILQDGFGGRGHRFNVVYLDSAAHRALGVQEQICRTGVITSRYIPMREPCFITGLNIDAGYANRARRYIADDQSLNGDWFASRSVQAHLLMNVQSTRARVEISDGPEGPAVLSGIGTTLADVFYRDAKQKIWHAQNLKTGERKKMQSASYNEFNRWLRDTNKGGGHLRSRLDDASGQKDFFYASAAEPTEHVIPTLPAINWTQDALVYFGPVATAGGAP